MKFTNPDDVIGELQSALCLSMDAIRDAINFGIVNPSRLTHRKSWMIAAREYESARNHVDDMWSISNVRPLWMVECFVDDRPSLAKVQQWTSAKGGPRDSAFMFPELSDAGEFGFRVLFFTEDDGVGSLFKMFFE